MGNGRNGVGGSSGDLWRKLTEVDKFFFFGDLGSRERMGDGETGRREERRRVANNWRKVECQ